MPVFSPLRMRFAEPPTSLPERTVEEDQQRALAYIQRQDAGSNRTILGEFPRAFAGYAAGEGVGAESQRRVDAELSGDTRAEDRARRQMDFLRQKGAIVGQTVGSLRDVNDAESAARYAVGMIGSTAASALPSVAAGIAGSAFGPLGTLAGAFAPSYMQNQEAALASQYEDPEVMANSTAQERLTNSRVVGAASGALDALLPAKLAGTLLGKAGLKGVARETAEGVVTEAIPEVLQQEIGYQGQRALGSTAERDPWDYADAAVGGGLGGGALSGAAHGLNRAVQATTGLLAPKDAPPPTTPAQRRAAAEAAAAEVAAATNPDGTVSLDPAASSAAVVPPATDDGSIPLDGVPLPAAPAPVAEDTAIPLDQQAAIDEAQAAAYTPPEEDSYTLGPKNPAPTAHSEPKSAITKFADRAAVAIASGMPPMEALKHMFSNPETDAQNDSLQEADDPMFAGMSPEEVTTALAEREQRVAQNAGAWAEAILTREGFSDKVKARVASYNGDYSSPKVQQDLVTEVSRYFVKQRTAALTKALGERGKAMGTKMGDKLRGWLMSNNLQQIPLGDLQPLTNALAESHGAEAPQVARDLVTALANVDPATMTPVQAMEISKWVSSFKTLQSGQDIIAAIEKSKVPGVAEAFRHALSIPGAMADIQNNKGRNFLESQLLPEARRYAPQIAEFLDTAAMDLDSKKGPKRADVIAALAKDAFGSVETAEAVVKYYSDVRRDAFKLQRETSPDPHPDEGGYDLGRVEDGQEVTEKTFDNYDPTFRDGNTKRPFFSGSEEHSKALEERLAAAGPSGRKATMLEYAQLTGEDPARIYKAIRADLEERIFTEEDRNTDAIDRRLALPNLPPGERTRLENRRESSSNERGNLAKLYAERDALDAVIDDKGDEAPDRFNAALAKYNTVLVEKNETIASDMQLNRFRKLIEDQRRIDRRKGPSQEWRYAATEAGKLRIPLRGKKNPLILSAESMVHAARNRNDTIAQKFFDSLASVLARPEVNAERFYLDPNTLIFPRKENLVVDGDIIENKHEIEGVYASDIFTPEQLLEAGLRGVGEMTDEQRALYEKQRSETAKEEAGYRKIRLAMEKMVAKAADAFERLYKKGDAKRTPFEQMTYLATVAEGKWRKANDAQRKAKKAGLEYDPSVERKARIERDAFNEYVENRLASDMPLPDYMDVSADLANDVTLGAEGQASKLDQTNTRADENAVAIEHAIRSIAVLEAWYDALPPALDTLRRKIDHRLQSNMLTIENTKDEGSTRFYEADTGERINEERMGPTPEKASETQEVSVEKTREAGDYVGRRLQSARDDLRRWEGTRGPQERLSKAPPTTGDMAAPQETPQAHHALRMFAEAAIAAAKAQPKTTPAARSKAAAEQQAAKAKAQAEIEAALKRTLEEIKDLNTARDAGGMDLYNEGLRKAEAEERAAEAAKLITRRDGPFTPEEMAGFRKLNAELARLAEPPLSTTPFQASLLPDSSEARAAALEAFVFNHPRNTAAENAMRALSTERRAREEKGKKRARVPLNPKAASAPDTEASFERRGEAADFDTSETPLTPKERRRAAQRDARQVEIERQRDTPMDDGKAAPIKLTEVKGKGVSMSPAQRRAAELKRAAEQVGIDEALDTMHEHYAEEATAPPATLFGKLVDVINSAPAAMRAKEAAKGKGATHVIAPLGVEKSFASRLGAAAKAAGALWTGGKVEPGSVAYASTPGASRAGFTPAALAAHIQNISDFLRAGGKVRMDVKDRAFSSHNITGEGAIYTALMEAGVFKVTEKNGYAEWSQDPNVKHNRQAVDINRMIYGDDPTKIAVAHNSPHKVGGKFDWETHKGKGEGAAAFSEGHYVSTSDATSQHYKGLFSNEQDEVQARNEVRGRETDIRRLKELIERGAPNGAKWMIGNQGFAEYEIALAEEDIFGGPIDPDEIMSVEDWKTDLVRRLTDAEPLLVVAKQKLAAVTEGSFEQGKSPTYALTLDAQPDELLHWHKPLSEQNPGVLARLEGDKRFMAAHEDFNLFVPLELQRGSDVYQTVKEHMFKDDGVKASQYLRDELGFVAMEHYAQGSSQKSFPNYAVWNTDRLTQNYVEFNNQIPGAPVKLTREQMGAIEEEIRRVRGKNIDIIWKKMLGQSGYYKYNPETQERAVVLSIYSGADNTIGWHESLHDFVRTLGKDKAARQVLRDLTDATSRPFVLKQLHDLLDGFPEAQEQLKDPEERIAYAYQFWAAGELNLSKAGDTVFHKLAKFIREMLGVLTQSEKAEAILASLHEGRLSDPSVVAQALAKIQVQRASGKLVLAETANEKFDRLAGPLKRSMDKVFKSAVDELHDTNIPALQLVAKAFFDARTTTGFLPRRAQMENIWMNRWARIAEKVPKKELKELLDDLQSMKERTSPAALEVTQFFEEIYDYMVKAGVMERDGSDADGEPKWKKMEKIKKLYFPRVFDAGLIGAKTDEFRTLLQTHGHMSAMRANEIIDSLLRGSGRAELAESDHHLGFTPFAAAVNRRTLDFINPSNAAEFAAFQEKDFANIMSDYVTQAVHRAEYARNFDNNGEKIEAQLAIAKEQGATEDEIERARVVIRGLEGSLGHDMSPAIKKIQAAVLTAQNVILLPLAIFSQMVDPLGIAVRTGKMKDAGAAYMTALSEIKRALTKGPKGRHRMIAELMGAITNDIAFEAMGQSYTGMHMAKSLRMINRWFFKANGMNGWNNSMRIAAVKAGESYILEHRNDERAMEELGLTAADIRESAPGELDMSDKKMHRAMFRFVDGAVLRPNAAHRATWMSDPRFQLIAHLKQFSYSFQAVIMSRVDREAEQGNFTPLHMMAAYVPVMFAADMAKWLLITNVPQGWGMADYFSYSLQRSGILGKFGFGMDSLDDTSRGRIPGQSFLGPTFEHAVTMAQYLTGGPVSTERLVERTVPLVRYF